MQHKAHLAPEQALRLVKRRRSSILTVISFVLEIFRRLNDVFTAFYTPNTTHATFSFKPSPSASYTPPFVDFDPNFVAVGDIPRFKRCFCCISQAEYNPRHF
jgi:hypothetical protein